MALQRQRGTLKPFDKPAPHLSSEHFTLLTSAIMFYRCSPGALEGLERGTTIFISGGDKS